MENNPILLAKTPSMHGLSSLDKCYTYVGSLMLHKSMIIEALAFVRALDIVRMCVSKVNCYDNGTDSSSFHDNGGTPYLVDGALLLRYIMEVNINL